MNSILLPKASFSGSLAQVNSSEQITHINQVLGLQVGDSLKIGQIGGKLGSATIDKITLNAIELREVQLYIDPPSKLDLSVILALPRPKVLRRLIMDMTALGVSDIVLINSYRTQKSYWQSPMLARLDEFVLAGLQQGVDTIAPNITLEKRFKPFVEDKLASLLANNKQAIVAHPYSSLSLSVYLTQAAVATGLPQVLCIGSEGGWIDYEIELLAQHGCQAVNIGPRILRTEAAVNAIIGQWLLHH